MGAKKEDDTEGKNAKPEPEEGGVTVGGGRGKQNHKENKPHNKSDHVCVHACTHVIKSMISASKIRYFLLFPSRQKSKRKRHAHQAVL